MPQITPSKSARGERGSVPRLPAIKASLSLQGNLSHGRGQPPASCPWHSKGHQGAKSPLRSRLVCHLGSRSRRYPGDGEVSSEDLGRFGCPRSRRGGEGAGQDVRGETPGGWWRGHTGLLCHPDVHTRPIQMLTPGPDVHTRPRYAPPAHPHRAGASSAQMCPRCPSPPAVPAPPDVPLPGWGGGGEAAGTSRAHPGLAVRPGPLPAPALQRQGAAGFSALLAGTLPCGDRAAIPGFARGLSGQAGPPPCFPCPLLMWAAASLAPRCCGFSRLAPGMGESKDKAPF